MFYFERGMSCIGIGCAISYTLKDGEVEMELLVLFFGHATEGTTYELPDSLNFSIALWVVGKRVCLPNSQHFSQSAYRFG